MIKNKLVIIFLILLNAIPNAYAGWYVVSNYEGKVGRYPVHVSLQKYKFSNTININGSYYYDKYMIPIPLWGFQKDAAIVLCEINSNKEYEDILVQGKEKNVSNCPFKLAEQSEGASIIGSWDYNKKKHDVYFKRTNYLNNTSLATIENGTIEIPFWGQTKLHNFIGVYEENNNGISINNIKIISKSTGRVVQTIDPQDHDCEFGFFMTSIYQNVENGITPNGIQLNCYSTGSDYIIDYIFDKNINRYLFLK